MPIPTWAMLIMFTSFAPSPIAAVVCLDPLSSATIYCFCLGVTLQAIIDLHSSIKEISYCEEEF